MHLLTDSANLFEPPEFTPTLGVSLQVAHDAYVKHAADIDAHLPAIEVAAMRAYGKSLFKTKTPYKRESVTMVQAHVRRAKREMFKASSLARQTQSLMDVATVINITAFEADMIQRIQSGKALAVFLNLPKAD